MTVEDYSFQEAERVRLGRFPGLDTVLYRWARRIEETLFDRLRLELYAGASVVEEMKFSSFFSSLKRPRPIFFFSMEPFDGQGLFVLDNRFAHLCLNAPGSEAGSGAVLGPHNQRQLHGVVQALMSDFNQSWGDIFPVHTHLKKLTTYLFRARILNAHEPCLVAQIHLSGRNASSRLTWCFPRFMLEPALGKLEQQQLVPTLFPDRVTVPKGDPGQFIRDADYHLDVRLGSLEVKSSADLTVGNILPLQNPLGGDAVIQVNGQPLLVGSVGEVQGRYAVRVTGTYEERNRQSRLTDGAFRDIQWPEVTLD